MPMSGAQRVRRRPRLLQRAIQDRQAIMAFMDRRERPAERREKTSGSSPEISRWRGQPRTGFISTSMTASAKMP